MNIAKKIVEAIKGKQKPTGYDTTAVVKRVEGSTAWVAIPGGVDETPVSMTIHAEPGDRVNVRVAGGRAWITGNGTAPPTDDQVANSAVNIARKTNINLKKIEEKLENGDFDGTDGTDGEDGRSITAVVEQYCLANSYVIPTGKDFEDIRYSKWQTSIPDYVEGKYYWMRLEIHYSDGTIEYNEPIYDLGTQAAKEANIVAQEAATAAETAAEIAQSALDGVGNIENHFWADSAGVHVSEAEGSVKTGASQTIASEGTVMMRNGKLVTSWTGSSAGNAAVNFYDCSSSSARTADLIASYGRSGITHYINNIVAMALTASGLSFYSPDSAHNLQAVFGNSGANLYAMGKLAMALAAGSIKFYDSDGITEIASLGAAQAVLGKSASWHAVVKEDGLHVYKNETEQVAEFGEKAIVGSKDGNHVIISGTSLLMKNMNNETVAELRYGVISMSAYSVKTEFGENQQSNPEVNLENVIVGGTVKITITTQYEGATDVNTFPVLWQGGPDYIEVNTSSGLTLGQIIVDPANESVVFQRFIACAGSLKVRWDGKNTAVPPSFSFGEGTKASGANALAQGNHTSAAGASQAVFGYYNVIDESDEYAMIIGNGGYSSRSNAYAIDWEGNIRTRGHIYARCDDDSTGGLCLSAVQDFTYTKFAYATGFAAYATSGAEEPHAAKIGRTVELSGAYKTTAAQTSTGRIKLGTVPSGCAPLREIRRVQQGSLMNRFTLIIQTTGGIFVERYGTTELSAIPEGAWLNIGCTYISST